MTQLASSGAAETETLLEFRLDRHRLALPVDRILEVTQACAVQTLPGAPAVVEGAMNLRGRIVPVLDTRLRFGLAPAPLHPDHHFIVARTDSRIVSLRVDRAVDVIEVEPGTRQPTESVEPAAELVAGVVRRPDGLVVIHDLDRFLSAEEDLLLDRLLDEATPGAARGEGGGSR